MQCEISLLKKKKVKGKLNMHYHNNLKQTSLSYHPMKRSTMTNQKERKENLPWFNNPYPMTRRYINLLPRHEE
jgi:hypothetical protein